MSISRILFASSNEGKIREALNAARVLGVSILSPQDAIAAGLTRTVEIPDVDENAATYEGNATLKANAFFDWCGIPALADDAGLEVDALDGAPGLYSARYAGPDADRVKNREKLLAALAGVEERGARFYSCLVLKIAAGEYLHAEGILCGKIALEASGNGGFGYDNLFVPEGHTQTLATLKEQGVPVVTHRVAALQMMVTKLSRYAAGVS